MRIAQVAPLFESVPPKRYGGTERVVSYLTEELVRHGEDVTLFASEDSVTSAKLVSCCGHALRGAEGPVCVPHEVLQLEYVLSRRREFDLIHFHCDCMHLPLVRAYGVVSLTTLHGRLDFPSLGPLFREFSEVPVVSISHAQRAPLSRANWVGTVYHGLPEQLYTLQPQPSRYLAYVGRISPEKRVDRAIEIAARARRVLIIGGKVDPADREYFERLIAPHLKRPAVQFWGEIDDCSKQELLGHAAAALFPVDWPEPFGLVMIESMACGTPVVAFRSGSVPEVVDDGVTGYIVGSVEEAVSACDRAAQLDRAKCRRQFERRFTAQRMVTDYLALYTRLLQSRP